MVAWLAFFLAVSAFGAVAYREAVRGAEGDDLADLRATVLRHRSSIEDLCDAVFDGGDGRARPFRDDPPHDLTDSPLRLDFYEPEDN